MSERIRAEGTGFACTRTGRVLQLRGISLGGNCKIPANLPSHHSDKAAFFDHANVSYVGRPFPLEDMDDHLSRIRDWGFTLVRLVVTWEALEHAGWQKYDDEYIAYLRKIVEALPRYGLCCIIDAHQDVFSRLTGGSGAPGWVLSVIGLSLKTIHNTYAAHLHPLALLATDPPPSVWPTGYQKLSASTCNTVFWAGDTFAWKRKAPDGSGRGLSSFLQDAMCDAFGKLADALEGCEAVLGFEPMNEPHRGYLELHNMYTFDPNTDLQLGYHTSALQSFALGDGFPQVIPYYKPSFPHPTSISHHVVVNEAGERAWADGKQCIWREHGVWEWDDKSKKAYPMRHTYFEKDPRTGKPFEWYKDAWYPFVERFRGKVVKQRMERQKWMTFAAGIPNEFTPPWPEADQPDNFVSAPHFYDLHALFTKTFGNITFNVQGLSRGMFPLKAIYYGRTGVQDNYSLQISNIVKASDASTGRPCIIGEIGVPFDMNGLQAAKTQDWRWQERQMDALCTGLERAGANYVLWNYNPDNDDEHGDAWYGENFSLFSRSIQEKTGGDGGRSEDAFQRPYAVATAGIPLRTYFDMFSLNFIYEIRSSFQHTNKVSMQQTEVYVPRRRYAKLLECGDALVKVSNGSHTYNAETQILTWTHEVNGSAPVHRLEISVPDRKHWKPKPGNIDLSGAYRINDRKLMVRMSVCMLLASCWDVYRDGTLGGANKIAKMQLPAILPLVLLILNFPFMLSQSVGLVLQCWALQESSKPIFATVGKYAIAPCGLLFVHCLFTYLFELKDKHFPQMTLLPSTRRFKPETRKWIITGLVGVSLALSGAWSAAGEDVKKHWWIAQLLLVAFPASIVLM